MIMSANSTESQTNIMSQQQQQQQHTLLHTSALGDVHSHNLDLNNSLTPYHPHLPTSSSSSIASLSNSVLPSGPPRLPSISIDSYVAPNQSPSSSTPGGESLYVDARNWPYNNHSSMTTSLEDGFLTARSTSTHSSSPISSPNEDINRQLYSQSDKQGAINWTPINPHFSPSSSDPEKTPHFHRRSAGQMDAVLLPEPLFNSTTPFGALTMSFSSSLQNNTSHAFPTKSSSISEDNLADMNADEKYPNISPSVTDDRHHHQSDEQSNHSPGSTPMSPVSTLATDQFDTLRAEMDDNDDSMSDFSNGKPCEEVSIEQVTKLAFKKGPYLPLIDLQLNRHHQHQLNNFDPIHGHTPKIETSAELRGETKVKREDSIISNIPRVIIDEAANGSFSTASCVQAPIIVQGSVSCPLETKQSPSSNGQLTELQDGPVSGSTAEKAASSPAQWLPKQHSVGRPIEQAATGTQEASADDTSSDPGEKTSASNNLSSTEASRLIDERLASLIPTEDRANDVPVNAASLGAQFKSSEPLDIPLSQSMSENSGDLGLFSHADVVLSGTPQHEFLSSQLMNPVEKEVEEKLLTSGQVVETPEVDLCFNALESDDHIVPKSIPSGVQVCRSNELSVTQSKPIGRDPDVHVDAAVVTSVGPVADLPNRSESSPHVLSTIFDGKVFEALLPKNSVAAVASRSASIHESSPEANTDKVQESMAPAMLMPIPDHFAELIPKEGEIQKELAANEQRSSSSSEETVEEDVMEVVVVQQQQQQRPIESSALEVVTCHFEKESMNDSIILPPPEVEAEEDVLGSINLDETIASVVTMNKNANESPLTSSSPSSDAARAEEDATRSIGLDVPIASVVNMTNDQPAGTYSSPPPDAVVAEDVIRPIRLDEPIASVCTMTKNEPAGITSLSLDAADVEEDASRPTQLDAPISSVVAMTKNKPSGVTFSPSPHADTEQDAIRPVTLDEPIPSVVAMTKNEPAGTYPSPSPNAEKGTLTTVPVQPNKPIDERAVSPDAEVEAAEPHKSTEPLFSMDKPLEADILASEAEALKSMALTVPPDNSIVTVVTQRELTDERSLELDAGPGATAKCEHPLLPGCQSEPAAMQAMPLEPPGEVPPASGQVLLPGPTGGRNLAIEAGSQAWRTLQVVDPLPSILGLSSAPTVEDSPGLNVSVGDELPPVSSHFPPVPLAPQELAVADFRRRLIESSNLSPDIEPSPVLASSSHPKTEDAGSQTPLQGNVIASDTVHRLEGQEPVSTSEVVETREPGQNGPSATFLPTRVPTVPLSTLPPGTETKQPESLAHSSLKSAVRRSKSMSKVFLRSLGWKENLPGTRNSVPDTTPKPSSATSQAMGPETLKKKRSLAAFKRKPVVLNWRQNLESPPELPKSALPTMTMPSGLSSSSKPPGIESSFHTLPSKKKKSSDGALRQQAAAHDSSSNHGDKHMISTNAVNTHVENSSLPPDPVVPPPTTTTRAAATASRHRLPPPDSFSSYRKGYHHQPSSSTPSSVIIQPPLENPTNGGIGHSPVLSSSSNNLIPSSSPKKKRIMMMGVGSGNSSGQQRLAGLIQKLLGRKASASG